jgi:hypothetical protein
MFLSIKLLAAINDDDDKLITMESMPLGSMCASN